MILIKDYVEECIEDENVDIHLSQNQIWEEEIIRQVKN
jgi:hypothetical protein